MLSRVADSLYWMGRYFERADHCARVLEANYNLMLNPSKLSSEQRWDRMASCLGFGSDCAGLDSQIAIARLTGEMQNRSSIVGAINAARENASQVREQISSEMWERLNQLFHEMNNPSLRAEKTSDPMRLVAAMREGSYKFHGVTDATMNHGEGWHFIQLGKYIERASALSVLLDAHFLHATDADDLDWICLLASCAAFEAYCRVYTADLRPGRVAEFLLLNSEFPFSVRFAADRMEHTLEAIALAASVRKTGKIERIIGSLRASLAYVQIEDIIAGNLHHYLNGIIEQCLSLHAALHQAYIDYPIESAVEV
jgi:uncharacterized alpha-E superfamily protein